MERREAERVERERIEEQERLAQKEQEELDEIEEAKIRTPVAVISNVVAKKSSSDESSSVSLSDEDGDFSITSSSGDIDEEIDEWLMNFLRHNDLAHIYQTLVDAGVNLDGLKLMDVGHIRSLPGLDYANASNLCTALGLKNIH